ncbi:hypothetical protein HHA01_26540 [Halomonas halmophila]|uniref:Uncharacterized protein n=1 Tax=Halomonas halmophila TaxID=252 RepID=A0A4Y4F2H6_9GAMM|nr:hypothetical protein HHA01_26540 [Halomonas halmophila]
MARTSQDRLRPSHSERRSRRARGPGNSRVCDMEFSLGSQWYRHGAGGCNHRELYGKGRGAVRRMAPTLV